jgi:hypothetical protein
MESCPGIATHDQINDRSEELTRRDIIGILRLSKDPEIDRRRILVSRIISRSPIQRKRQNSESRGISQRCRIWASSILALASMSSPTKNQCTSAWYPPLAVIPIFVVGGGGSALTPLRATRSVLNWTNSISSNTAVTSDYMIMELVFSFSRKFKSKWSQ